VVVTVPADASVDVVLLPVVVVVDPDVVEVVAAAPKPTPMNAPGLNVDTLETARTVQFGDGLPLLQVIAGGPLPVVNELWTVKVALRLPLVSAVAVP